MKFQRTVWTGMECGTFVFTQTDTIDLTLVHNTQQNYVQPPYTYTHHFCFAQHSVLNLAILQSYCQFLSLATIFAAKLRIFTADMFNP